MNGRLFALCVVLFGVVSLGADNRGCKSPDYPDAGTGGSPGVGGAVVVVDAGPDAEPDPIHECDPQGTDDCALAGERVCRLGCVSKTGAPLWRSSKRSFVDMCRQAEADTNAKGESRTWRPDCVKRITSCEQLDRASSTPKGAECRF